MSTRLEVSVSVQSPGSRGKTDQDVVDQTRSFSLVERRMDSTHRRDIEFKADMPSAATGVSAQDREDGAGLRIACRLTATMTCLLSAAMSPSDAGAATLYFDAAGGSKNWNQTTTPAWSTVTGGPYNITWNAGSGTDAVFEGTGGTVNIQATAPVAVNSLVFGTSGGQLYTIGGVALNLAPAATITTNTNATIDSAITGAGTSLVKNGTGTLTFSTAKTYTGATTVNAGELILRNASGFVSATTVNSGAKLTFTGSTNVSLSAAATVTLNDGATLQNINPSGYVQLLGAVTANGNTTINANQVAGAGRGLYLDGGLKGSGTVTINTVNASNSVILRNNNSTFSGTLIINGIANSAAGAGSGLALGGAATSNALINANVVLNGTIELADRGFGSGFGTSVFNMGSLSGSGIIVGNRATNGNFGATVVLGNTNDSGVFSGSIVKGSGVTNVVGVTKVGTGTQVFSGANSYTGATNVNAGVLNIRNNLALGATTNGTRVASGAALQMEGDITVAAEALALNGTGVANDGALRNVSGNNAYAGLITLQSATRINSDAGMLTLGAITGAAQNLTLGGAGDITVTGSIGTTSGTLTKDGNGTAILSGTNTYTGGTTIRAGTLQISQDANLGDVTGALDLDGGTLRVTQDLSTARTVNALAGGGAVDTGGNTMTLTGALSGSGNWSKLGTGTLVLAGSNSASGIATVAAGTLLAGGTDTFGPASGYAINSGATLDLAGFNQTVSSVNNSGTVSLVGSAPGTTLTVTGPWVGNGGTLRMGTALGDNSSLTDRLVFSGAGAIASGTTQIQIVNLGGLGAQTTGNGIEIISATGGANTTAQTTRNAFRLVDGHVDAGAYEYRLYAADINGAGQNWYLRSSIIGGTPPVEIPTYRAEVPLFAALPEQLRESDLAMLGNLHQRVGDDEVAGSHPGGANQGRRQAWGRLISMDRSISQSGVISPKSEGRLNGFQTGTDLWGDPDWRVGVYVGQLEGDMRVSGFARGIVNYAAGGNHLRNEYFGGYATWKNQEGFYVDMVLQFGRLRYTVQPTLSNGASGKGSSMLTSVEVGKTFQLAPGWHVEPQLQLVRQDLDLNDADIAGATVHQNADSSWLLRAGVRVKGETALGAGDLQPYGRVNVYRRSGGEDISRYGTQAANSEFETGAGGTSMELAVGATWQLTPTLSMYGEIGQLWANSSSTKTEGGVNGSVGVKVAW